jgi:hypothetical protein
VVKNITGFSVAIGIIFAIIWYAFPGKFVSYKGDYSDKLQGSVQYLTPDELMSKEKEN